MAYSYTLQMNFKDENGKSVKFSYPYCKEEFTANQVKLVMLQYVANKEIFKSKPAVIDSAYLVATQSTQYTLPE